jgi:hypothetical protein
MTMRTIIDTTFGRAESGSGIVAAAVEIGRNIRSNRHMRRFQAAATNFAGLLGGVPDCAAGEVGDEEVDRLARVASEVIDAIELRVDDDTLRESDKLELVTVVYRIRRHLEELEYWRRHYSGVGSR